MPKLVNSNELVILLANGYTIVATSSELNTITKEEKESCTHWCSVKRDGCESNIYITKKEK